MNRKGNKNNAYIYKKCPVSLLTTERQIKTTLMIYSSSGQRVRFSDALCCDDTGSRHFRASATRSKFQILIPFGPAFTSRNLSSRECSQM